MTDVRRQRGFTLIELMIATAIGMLLMSSVLTILYQSAGMADSLQAQLTVNREAREMFLMMTEGGVGQQGKYVPGIRATLTGGADPAVSRDANDFRLKLVGSAQDTTTDSLLSSRVADLEVDCDDVGEPVGECTGSVGTETVNGYLTRDPETNPADLGVAVNLKWSLVRWEIGDLRQRRNRFATKDLYRSYHHAIIGHVRQK